jgi:NADPH2:quinone reductase
MRVVNYDSPTAAVSRNVMRAVVVEEHGDPEVLCYLEVTRPAPGPGQVRIATELTSVNYADIHARRGGYDAGAALPFTPGLDCVGLVESLGEGVTGLRVGQRVSAWTSGGSYAEQVLAPETMTFPLPADVPIEVGASLTVLVTAYNVLTRAQLAEGETVLVHGATGGVGSAAVQLANAMGAREVYATTGGDDKSQAALALGAAAAIDHTREDFAERVRELTGGRGVDVIVDPIGGEVTERGMTCLAPFGRLVICGHTAGPAAAIGTKDLHRHHRSVLGYSTGYLRRTRPESLRTAVEEVFRQAAVGALRVDVAARLPLAKAADAQRLAEDRSAIGRVLLATDDHRT